MKLNMSIDKQKQLVRLLAEYQESLIILDTKNKMAINNNKYEDTISVKSKYEFARKIKADLEKNIEQDFTIIY